MKSIFLLATSLYLSASAVAAEPNLVYVLADQWRASPAGYAGDPNVKTPNLAVWPRAV